MRFHSFRHIFEAIQDNPDAFFLHPLGIVALLRKRPGVALNKHRKFANHGFRDASRAGFANQKIRRAHQLMNFFRETDDVYRQLPIVRAQFSRQLIVPAANQD